VTEKFSEMVARNHHFYLAGQRSGVADWLVVGFARTAQGAEAMRRRADQKLSDQHRIPSVEEQEAEHDAWLAEIADEKAGKPPKPPTPPWWVSET